MKIVIINGFRRGGTNLLWNILCSMEGASTLTLNRNGREENVEVGEYFAQKSENDFKLFIADKKLLVCKGVNDDIKYNSIIKKYSNEVLELGLVRDKIANCEGWVRRGLSIDDFIKEYNNFIDSLKINNNKLICFKTVIERPFDVLHKVCEIIGEPKANKITFRSKNVYKSVTHYGPAFGNVNDYITIVFEDLAKGYICKKADDYQKKNLALIHKDYLESNCKNAFDELSSSQYIL